MTKAKALTRSMDRRGSQSDKTPPVARRQRSAIRLSATAVARCTGQKAGGAVVG